MCAFSVVMLEPLIQVGLQLLNGFVQVLAERDLVELLQNGLVEPLANAVGLRMFDLGFGVIDIPSRRRFACLPGND